MLVPQDPTVWIDSLGTKRQARLKGEGWSTWNSDGNWPAGRGLGRPVWGLAGSQES